jgi:hypothetical protein
MSIPPTHTEARILTLVQERGAISLEELLACLSESTWSQVFTSVDALSRQGMICLQRRNFEYELRPASPLPSTTLLPESISTPIKDHQAPPLP